MGGDLPQGPRSPLEDGTMWRGIPLASMSREALARALVQMNQMWLETIERHAGDMRVLTGLSRDEPSW